MDGWGTGEQGLEESGSPSTGEGGGRRWQCPLGWNEVSTAAEHLTTDSWLKATQADCVPVSVGCHLSRKLDSGTGRVALPSRCQEAGTVTWSSGLPSTALGEALSLQDWRPSAARSQTSLSAFRPCLWPLQPQPATEDQLQVTSL